MIQGEEVIVGCSEVDGCILECEICMKHGSCADVHPLTQMYRVGTLDTYIFTTAPKWTKLLNFTFEQNFSTST